MSPLTRKRSHRISNADLRPPSPSAERARSSLPQQYLSSRGSSSRELEIQFHRSPSPGSLGHKAHASAAISKSSDISFTKDRAFPWSLGSFDRSAWVIANQDINAATKTSTQRIDDTQKAPSITLPSFVPDNREGLPPHIDTKTLAGLMGARLRDCFDNLVVIDCRFKYEFDGGHIKGAVNYSEKAALKDLFHSPKTHTVLVLYCEYSSFRAPTMFKHVRQMDREMNSNTYPNLTYPDMFILNGGYGKVFTDHKSLCTPQNYVKMSDEDHNVARERGLSNIKRNSKLIS
ncbi:cell division cycle 25 [Elasticomyces elasticus]|nr:cell division cycle 25 [Elasticomyces elasticus]